MHTQVATATRSHAFFVMVVLDHATNTATTGVVFLTLAWGRCAPTSDHGPRHTCTCHRRAREPQAFRGLPLFRNDEKTSSPRALLLVHVLSDTGTLARCWTRSGILTLNSHWNPATVPHIAHVPCDIASQAAQRQERRQRVRSHSMGMGSALSEKDLRDLHSLWSVYRDRAASASDVPSSSSLQHSKVRLHADERLMADNRLESTLLIWPNEMNVHGTLFGGIVTRTAIEMAYMTVAQYLHSTAWATLIAVDDVFFLNPIPSGAMTKYLGQVRQPPGVRAR